MSKCSLMVVRVLRTITSLSLFRFQRVRDASIVCLQFVRPNRVSFQWKQCLFVRLFRLLPSNSGRCIVCTCTWYPGTKYLVASSSGLVPQGLPGCTTPPRQWKCARRFEGRVALPSHSWQALRHEREKSFLSLGHFARRGHTRGTLDTLNFCSLLTCMLVGWVGWSVAPDQHLADQHKHLADQHEQLHTRAGWLAGWGA